MAVTLAELARRLQGKVRGNPELRIERVAPLESAGPHDISFISDKKYLPKLERSAAGAVILTKNFAGHRSGPSLIVEDPQLCFARVAQWLHPLPEFKPGIHASAAIDDGARIAASAWIGPQAVVEAGALIQEHAYIGAGSFVGAHATVGVRTRLVGQVFVGERCAIGRDCHIHPGVVIGADGFGFAKDGDQWIKVPQLGRVVIGDRVEIGANTTIDRGALNDTVIGHGVKLDNLIQIAHNVHIGDDTAIAACVGIAGSTHIGCRCTVGGQAGITGHLDIADDTHITAGSLVTSSIKRAGVYSSSLKAEPVASWRRNAARLHHLDEMSRKLKSIEEKLQQNTEEREN